MAEPPSPEIRPHENVESAFNLLHYGVQRQLWRMKWTHLRPLQVQAIHAIIERSGHLILSAGTAAGKTEAAFLPALSMIADSPAGSIRALYVGPLKALINDQFSRLNELCEYLDVPVLHWHGDVSAAEKKKVVTAPAGVLLITPESLESLFVNRSEHLAKLFCGLQFIVIDELHSFLANDRGLHLRSLLNRLRHLPISITPRLIGLSATIGDATVAQQYLDPGDPERVSILRGEDDKEIQLKVHGYLHPSDDVQPDAGDEVDPLRLSVAEDIVMHCRGKSNLVFANAKGDVEEFCALCQQLCQSQILPDRFFVHHGSLSAMIREETEFEMQQDRPTTTVCSSTLEMGIDIGGVTMVGQIGAPWSVTALRQRLGRSGRKADEPHVLRVYLECQEPDADANVFESLHLPLVQTVAVIELMINGWLEPDSPATCDLSTLTQQIISVIAQHGGSRADLLYGRLCEPPYGAFSGVDSSVFVRLLRALAEFDVIEQTHEGDLILGLEGERLRNHFGFYAVFQTPEAFRVVYQGELLGELEIIPQVDEYLLFAGRRWQVDAIDVERRELSVRPARGWKRPKFLGLIGNVHHHVRQHMRNVLSQSGELAYLDGHSKEILKRARRASLQAGVCDELLLQLGRRSTAIMTWTGSRVQQTLAAMLCAKNCKVFDEDIALVVPIPIDETQRLLRECLVRESTPEQLASYVQPRLVRKYDRYLTDDLLDECTSRDRLDLQGAKEVLGNVLDRRTD